MTYLRPSNRKNSRSRTIGIFSAVIIVLVVMIEMIWPHLFSALFTSIAAPFWRIEFSMDNGSLDSREALLAENASLKMSLEDISIRSQAAQSIAVENTELKTLMGREVKMWPYSLSNTPGSTTNSTSSLKNSVRTSPKSSAKHDDLVLAAVLKHPPFVPFDELIIDIGSMNGVIEGARVYAVGNILIGRVAQVLDETSKVVLYSSPEEKTDVIIGASKVSGVAVGRGGGQYEVSLPRDTVISIGDVVSAPSIDHEIVGIVSAIIKDPAEAFQKVIFIPPINISESRWVFVVRK